MAGVFISGQYESVTYEHLLAVERNKKRKKKKKHECASVDGAFSKSSLESFLVRLFGKTTTRLDLTQTTVMSVTHARVL